jgi:pyruvate dehydrogenase complex dehydrogenase (E1) component
LACVFHRILGREFVVASASVYDDYFNGIDTVLVDKETGDVICALDEVHDEEGRARHQKKIESIIKTAKKGGAKIKYGITFEKDDKTGANKLVQKTISNIPKFYLN